MLTDKEERFCLEYLIDLNATQAAKRAGYSEKTANEIGSQNLAKLSIQNRISELKQARVKRTEITADKVLKELAKIGFANISDYLIDGMSMKEMSSIARKKSAAIASIKKTVTTWDGGDKEIVEFKLHDKLRALENIGKHIGFFEIDNKQKGLLAEQVTIYKLPDNNRDNGDLETT
jgi:phage terminase small subunit